MGIAAILGLVVLTCSVQNFQTINLNLFGSTLPIPLGVSLVGAWVSGLVASLALWQTKIKEVKSQKTLQKWEVQDAKLLQEVESDKIKQLEAKIATLDAALNQQLKKKG
jgi:uncharacterized integral membrane protein